MLQSFCLENRYQRCLLPPPDAGPVLPRCTSKNMDELIDERHTIKDMSTVCRAILMVILTIASTSVWAEWVLVSGSAVDGISAYADSSTIRKKNNRVTMWTLIDYKAPQKSESKTFMSVKSQNEYDCRTEQSRIIYANVYQKSMAKGELISASIKPRNWEPNEPDSVGEALWGIACEIGQ